MSVFDAFKVAVLVAICCCSSEAWSLRFNKNPKPVPNTPVNLSSIVNDDQTIETSDIVIANPIVTSYGDWSNWEHCLNDTYASAMILKTEATVPGDRYFDDTALNGVKLLCIPPGSNDFDAPNATDISSSVGRWGEWGRPIYCDKGVITGFQLRSHAEQGRRKKGDNTGANNLRVYCSNLNGGFLEGDGLDWGEWTAPQKCLSQQAVCGIQTQVQSPVGDRDDTALNNLRMKCCSVSNIALHCDPTDQWETILECDNTNSTSPLTCTYSKVRGVTKSSSASEEMINEHTVMMDLGFTGSLLYSGLSLNFRFNYTDESHTGYKWSSESSESFHEAVTTTAEFTVECGMKARLSQAVGSCGVFGVYSNYFRKEDLVPGTEIAAWASYFYD